MKTLTVYTDVLYQMLGARHPSDKMQLEATTTYTRWSEIIEIMTDFGLGRDEIAAFLALIEKHREALAKRSNKIVAKGMSIEDRNAAINAGWAWTAKTIITLSGLARTDTETARRINETRPVEDTDLASSIQDLADLLAAKADKISPAIPVQKRLEEATELVARLHTVFSDAENAKGKPMEDTAELDILDGKLYVIIRDFNEAGRAAVRAGLLPDRAPYFRFNHIGSGYFRKKAEGGDPAIDDPAPEPEPEA